MYQADKITKLLFILKLLFVTVVAIIAAYYAIATVNISGISSTSATAQDIINQRCPIHIVKPEWVNGGDQFDKLWNWCLAETKARLAFILILWFGGVVIISRHHLQTSTRP